MVRNRRARVWLRWHGGEAPPGLKMGQRVHLLGRIVTFNNGYLWQLQNCVLLKQSAHRILAKIETMIPDIIDDAHLAHLELLKPEMQDGFSELGEVES